LEEKTYHITTFGCQMNEHDSEKLAGMLERMGYAESGQRNASDIVIINTCSVREHADERFFGTLGQLKKSRLENPGQIVAVCGCMMQQQHVVDRLKNKFPWVDLVFGTHNIHEFPKLIENLNNEKSRQVAVWDDSGLIVEGLPSKRKYPYKAFVNIMYGCNNFCTYCIVPYTRGRERSREPEEILREIQKLAAEGTKEVTLLGQNVNSYGSGCSFDMDFAGLLYRINEIEGIERIRFMTSHPKDLSDRLVLAFRDCDRLCRHIHLPVQSGSSAVLERMNRNYTKERYLELVMKLKQTVPDIAITTDIIVGFPGETEAEFEETLDLVRTVEFDSAFTFMYSVRQGTPAESFGDQIPEEIKHDRFNRLVELLNSFSLKKNAAYQDRITDVLVEGFSKSDRNMFTGRTDSNKLVNFSAGPEDIGKIVKVQITEARTFSLAGRRIG